MQFRISYIVYSYNSEETIERCIESLAYGEEKNIEIIILEDGSRDGSPEICRKLEKQFDSVRCVYSQKHNGRAYMRNQAMKTVNGKYTAFIESKDWACREYGALLYETAERSPKTLVISGYRTTTGVFGYEHDWFFNGGEKKRVESEDYFSLAGHELLQMLWNKIFLTKVIRIYDLQFDETRGMQSEFHFIVDYVKTAGCRKFVMLNRPLYTSFRKNEPVFDGGKCPGEFAAESEEYERISDFMFTDSETRQEQLTCALSQLRQKYIYRIMCDRELSVKEKLSCMVSMRNGRRTLSNCLMGLKDAFLENLRAEKKKISRKREKKRKKRQKAFNARLIQEARKNLTNEDVSIISQNCIGGVFYHDMGLKFQSPTINLFFDAADFLKFVSDIHYYMQCHLIMYWGKDYPIGELGDIKIYFMHYPTCRVAAEDWERRKERVNYDRILVLGTDRDGFSDREFQIWKNLSYQKVLFTVNSKYKGERGVIYYSKYRKHECIPDLIFAREFYKDGTLVSTVNEV